MQVTLFAFGSGDTSVFGWTVAPNFKPTAQGAQNNQQRGLTMRTHSYGWISSARLQLRGVLVLCGLLLGYQPAARADTGWAATATQGITLTNFAIQAQSHAARSRRPAARGASSCARLNRSPWRSMCVYSATRISVRRLK
jgi:hypothetical protein